MGRGAELEADGEQCSGPTDWRLLGSARAASLLNLSARRPRPAEALNPEALTPPWFRHRWRAAPLQRAARAGSRVQASATRTGPRPRRERAPLRRKP